MATLACDFNVFAYRILTGLCAILLASTISECEFCCLILSAARGKFWKFFSAVSPSVLRRGLDQGRHLFWPGRIHRVTGALNFDLVAVCACRIPPFEIGVDGSVSCRYCHPTRFASPCSCRDDRFEIAVGDQHLRVGRESGFFFGSIGCEVFAELRRVELIKAV
jgi:hypothetical protein